MKEKTCCFTGHRDIPPDQLSQLMRRLEQAIIRLVEEEGVLYFGAGGALGFDTLAAQTVLGLKRRYPQIKLILVLPCKNQTAGWGAKDIKIYESIKRSCDKYIYMSEAYRPGCMFERNRRLVDCSGTCLCYLTKSRGGTAYTVAYAQKRNVQIINLAGLS